MPLSLKGIDILRPFPRVFDRCLHKIFFLMILMIFYLNRFLSIFEVSSLLRTIAFNRKCFRENLENFSFIWNYLRSVTKTATLREQDFEMEDKFHSQHAYDPWLEHNFVFVCSLYTCCETCVIYMFIFYFWYNESYGWGKVCKRLFFQNLLQFDDFSLCLERYLTVYSINQLHFQQHLWLKTSVKIFLLLLEFSAWRTWSVAWVAILVFFEWKRCCLRRANISLSNNTTRQCGRTYKAPNLPVPDRWANRWKFHFVLHFPHAKRWIEILHSLGCACQRKKKITFLIF